MQRMMTIIEENGWEKLRWYDEKLCDKILDYDTAKERLYKV